MTEKTLLLIDGHSMAFRAFYGLSGESGLMRNREGLHTNALYAFHNMLDAKLSSVEPSHVLVAFDAGKTTFRHESFKDYKGGRDSMPSELSEQMPYFRVMLDAFGIQYYELDQYEADDIIGTLSKQADEAGYQVVIMSGDRDLSQLVSDHIRLDFTKRGGEIEEITPGFLKENYGLTPEQVPDYLGLKGDPSDNIPGVTSVGEKRALKLLEDYHSIENLYDHVDELKDSKMKEHIISEEDMARLSKELATINRQAPVEVTLDSLVYQGKDMERLVEFYKDMDFQQHLAQLDLEDLAQESPSKVNYTYVDEFETDMLGNQQVIYLEMLEENYHTSPIECLAIGDDKQVFVTSLESALESDAFKDWLADEKIEKYCFDAKATLVALSKAGLKLNGVRFDVLLADYLLTAANHSDSVADVARNHGIYTVAMDESVYGKGKKVSLPEDIEDMYAHVATKVQAIFQLIQGLEDGLEDNEQAELLHDIELPLAKVLAKMELRGIRVDADYLLTLQDDFQVTLDELEEAIYEKAGEVFNINSPKQLGVILFEKMGYPVIRKTKTGYSTAQDVLEKLQDQAPIVDDILTYRQIKKIQSTYVEGLLAEIDDDQKVHTRFLQTATRTGRLSSVEPNLQNIPIRTEEGRQIRKAFTGQEPGWLVYSSDYSQIELRVMAHISGDEHMKEAFQRGEDIHAATAVRIFDLDSLEDVTSNMRRDAKAINFGIIYGMSDYGLSQNLSISRQEAKEFIDIYFERYPGIQRYMDEVVREAKDKGYVETLFHRRRYLPDINARNFNQRSFAERTAINTPIQGSAADIIKMAMIEMEDRLEKENLQARMLLQVHDELIFEVPEDELDALQDVVKDVMEHIVDLDVPLEVDGSYGHNWYETK